MTDKEQNKSEVHQEPTSKHITGMNSRGKDRRRFIKRAIVAAPFILTVASRPVWAGNCTMSGQLSGNLSDPDGTCGGEGCSADKWKDNLADKWHHEFPPNCAFDKVFDTNVFEAYTLFQVISKKTPGVPAWKRDLGCQAVAALQNAATRVSYEYMVCDLIYDVRIVFDSDDKVTIEQLEGILTGLNEGQPCPLL